MAIAMCTYNGAEYLTQQLESIANQTYLPRQLVVCDDCSQDETIDILEKFSKIAPFHVDIYKNKKNIGSTKNFEQAIQLCNADLIALADQDDVWIPDKLLKLTIQLDSHPNAGFAFSDASMVDSNLNPLGYTMWQSVNFSKLVRHYQKGEDVNILIQRNVVTGATMAFRQNIRNMITPIPRTWVHDGWISLVLSIAGQPGLPINEPLILYRQHRRQQLGGLKKNKLSELINPTEGRAAFKEQLKMTIEAYEDLKMYLMNQIIEKDSNMQNSPIKQINEKISHLKKRALFLKKNRIARIIPIIRELRQGGYHRYSNSYESAIKDLQL